MSSIIYETINLYNKEKNVLPYLYIGSDQYNDPKYLGSSRDLLKDIKKIGKEHFEKRILCEFNYEIDNVTLRKIESNIQKSIDVANDPKYYNKTNTSHKGYVETEEQRKERMKKTHIGYKIWLDGLSDDERKIYKDKSSKNITQWNNSIKGKSYEEIYGEEKGKERRLKKMGSNNVMSKQVLDIKTGKIFETMKIALDYYNIKKYETLRKKCEKGIVMKFL